MIEIIPALLVHDSVTFKHHLSVVQDQTDFVQVDIEDGSFVSNKTWFDTVNLIEEDYNVKYFLHLMIDDPVEFVTNFPKVEIRHIKGFTAHLETLKGDNLDLFVGLVKSLGVEVGIASVKDFTNFTTNYAGYDFDEALVLGVNPGESGQHILRNTNGRLIRAKGIAKTVAVDGGVTQNNIRDLIDNGARRIYMSSGIFDQENPSKAYKKLKESVHEIF